MAIFVIVPQPHQSQGNLPGVIASEFEGKFLPLWGGHGWLIAATSTAKELSDKLGITDGKNGAALVLEVASYFGRGDPNIWTWVKNNWGAPNG